MEDVLLSKRLDTIESKLDKAIDSFSEEKERMAVYKYRIEELEKKISGTGMFWRSVAISTIVLIIGIAINYAIYQSKATTPDNNKYLEKLEKTLDKINEKIDKK
jgi:peptidoglycan hydrolase CwlO-like protein